MVDIARHHGSKARTQLKNLGMAHLEGRRIIQFFNLFLHGFNHARSGMADITAPQTCCSIKDLPSVIDDFREKGVTFRGELIEGPGGKQILIEDPSGNAIELFETRD